jgi:hypothetical protein
VLEDETPRERHARIDSKLDKLEDRLERLEHYKTFLTGVCTAFGFCGAFIGFLLKTYVFK